VNVWIVDFFGQLMIYLTTLALYRWVLDVILPKMVRKVVLWLFFSAPD
jgi:hypothetical protein